MKPRYWYKTYIDFCPVCGKETKWKERQFTEYPTDPDKRIEVKESYDWCDAL